eukprot:RCo055702
MSVSRRALLRLCSAAPIAQRRCLHTSPPVLFPSETFQKIAEATEDLADPPETAHIWCSETKPNQFLRRLDRQGREIPGDIDPKEMLVGTYVEQQHFCDTKAEALAYWLVRWTNDENWGKAVISMSKKFGAYKEKEVFFQFKDLPFPMPQVYEKHFELKMEAKDQYEKIMVNGQPEVVVFVTGATGFLGLDFIQSVARNPAVKKVISLVWHKEVGTKPMEEFTKNVLKRVDIPEETYGKFTFVAGDVTAPNLGLSPQDAEMVTSSCTHMLHLAASVSFEDPYDKMYRANVLSTQHALEFGLAMQKAPNSKFVNYISTETCYIHGRDFELCREDELIFPRDYFNNYYELTKALADIQTRHFMLATGLRVVSLCPAIVIGHSRNGNNHGDTKVINAAGNAFGRIHAEMQRMKEPMRSIVLRLVLNFPSSTTALIDVVSIDRVTDGVVASLFRPLGTGERVHLASEGISADQFRKIFHEEVGIKLTFSNPVIHRYIRRPILKVLFKAIGQPKLYRKLEQLFEIFGSYSQWGQPVHELGNDVRVLGLSEERPNLVDLTRVLVRHNQIVQDWGKLRNPAEIGRREKIWKEFIADLEARTGQHVGRMPPAEFKQELKRLKF